MLKEYIGTGKTIEEATAVAKAGLNAPLSADVKVEVITMPQKKFLGIFGGANAEVKASYDDGVKEKKQNKKQPKNNQKKEAPKKEKPAKTASVSVSEAPEEKKDAPKSVDLEYAKAYLGDILKGLNIDDAKIKAVYENGVVTMDLECEDFGIVIGR
ncbi:MAG: Jag N-terminal domain-containing protein, partial [Eubacterium sp.]|nr:Jag N-terminal domain-containing protein [Eubacterium sp.]